MVSERFRSLATRISLPALRSYTMTPSSQRRLASRFDFESGSNGSWAPAFAGLTNRLGNVLPCQLTQLSRFLPSNSFFNLVVSNLLIIFFLLLRPNFARFCSACFSASSRALLFLACRRFMRSAVMRARACFRGGRWRRNLFRQCRPSQPLGAMWFRFYERTLRSLRPGRSRIWGPTL